MIKEIIDIKKINTTFIASNPKMEGKIMQLGRSFIEAVTIGDKELAEEIIKEAQSIKDKK